FDELAGARTARPSSNARRRYHGHHLLDVGAADAREIDAAQEVGSWRQGLAALDDEVGGKELAGFGAQAGVEAGRQPRHRHHRRHPHRQAGDEEPQPPGGAAALAEHRPQVAGEAQCTLTMTGDSWRSLRPSRRRVRRSARVAPPGWWVTRTRVVP